MDVARVNLSHGSIEGNRRLTMAIREISHEMGMEIAIMVDLQGPKIRCNRVLNGSMVLRDGDDEIMIRHSADMCSYNIINTQFKPLVDRAQEGDHILLDDGAMDLVVLRRCPAGLRCRVVAGGVLHDHKGINLPQTDLGLGALTPKDREDLGMVLKLDIDYIALSFVQAPGDIAELRRLIHEAGRDIRIVAKMEKPQAMANLDDILEVTDAVMVARGDLAVETATELVPIYQKRMIRGCIARGLPVITATQMLDSMFRCPKPTRAEASDVANAVFDGTDATMLSGESAAGDHPFLAVSTMATIARTSEQHCAEFANYHAWTPAQPRQDGAKQEHKGLVVLAEDSRKVGRVTTLRPGLPVIALCASLHTVRRLRMLRGALGVHVPGGALASLEGMPAGNQRRVLAGYLKQAGVASPGDRFLLFPSPTARIPATVEEIRQSTLDALVIP
eukprot:gnl/Trimastix_PCT/1588.p1 GENE.gnl/Trimastix_PCT/1588~~gnl/Trimastix_PCT/1588.p1  ORF type:complete len:521 (+),score=122.28 gnl/Trimastix_PCT/1588:225-1565(+)